MKPIRRNTIPHDSRTRDAALRRLRRTNRWLIAGSAVLTGLFVDLAASAFSGHASNAAARSQTHSKSSQHTSTQSLKAPEQAPKPAETQSTEAPPPSEQERAPESSAPESSAPESSAPEPSAPAQEPAPAETHESAPEPAPEPSEPVVSGGS